MDLDNLSLLGTFFALATGTHRLVIANRKTKGVERVSPKRGSFLRPFLRVHDILGAVFLEIAVRAITIILTGRGIINGL